MERPKDLPIHQPTEDQKAWHPRFFRVGQMLKLKPVDGQPVDNHVYVTIDEPYLADEHDDEWTVHVEDQVTGLETASKVGLFIKFEHSDRKVRPGE